MQISQNNSKLNWTYTKGHVSIDIYDSGFRSIPLQASQAALEIFAKFWEIASQQPHTFPTEYQFASLTSLYPLSLSLKQKKNLEEISRSYTLVIAVKIDHLAATLKTSLQTKQKTILTLSHEEQIQAVLAIEDTFEQARTLWKLILHSSPEDSKAFFLLADELGYCLSDDELEILQDLLETIDWSTDVTADKARLFAFFWKQISHWGHPCYKELFLKIHLQLMLFINQAKEQHRLIDLVPLMEDRILNFSVYADIASDDEIVPHYLRLCLKEGSPDSLEIAEGLREELIMDERLTEKDRDNLLQVPTLLSLLKEPTQLETLAQEFALLSGELQNELNFNIATTQALIPVLPEEAVIAVVPLQGVGNNVGIPLLIHSLLKLQSKSLVFMDRDAIKRKFEEQGFLLLMTGREFNYFVYKQTVELHSNGNTITIPKAFSPSMSILIDSKLSHDLDLLAGIKPLHKIIGRFNDEELNQWDIKTCKYARRLLQRAYGKEIENNIFVPSTLASLVKICDAHDLNRNGCHPEILAKAKLKRQLASTPALAEQVQSWLDYKAQFDPTQLWQLSDGEFKEKHLLILASQLDIPLDDWLKVGAGHGRIRNSHSPASLWHHHLYVCCHYPEMGFGVCTFAMTLQSIEWVRKILRTAALLHDSGKLLYQEGIPTFSHNHHEQRSASYAGAVLRSHSEQLDLSTWEIALIETLIQYKDFFGEYLQEKISFERLQHIIADGFQQWQDKVPEEQKGLAENLCFIDFVKLHFSLYLADASTLKKVFQNPKLQTAFNLLPNSNDPFQLIQKQ